MRYRLTCLTPLLVGDGRRLSPIDYMVWKDQVNVLDQNRIFNLLAKGPRLEGYLMQLKKADKLDFASWGGFAQNFADRRIPFEHKSMTTYWERARAENLFIPTFAAGLEGPYIPGSAVKGALRTGLVFSRWSGNTLKDIAGRMQGERSPRRPGDVAEEQAIGAPEHSRMKAVAISDSAPVSYASMKVYLLRVATLVSRGAGRYELGWKQAPRGSVDGRRPEDSTPWFAEMAAPGTTFEGRLHLNQFFHQPEIVRALRWREPPDHSTLFRAANRYAADLLARTKSYAAMAGLGRVEASAGELEAEVSKAEAEGACILPLGWGAGLMAKSAWLDTGDETYRQVMSQVPLYAKAVQTGMPFPKTRRVVFFENQPAAMPGWVRLELTG